MSMTRSASEQQPPEQLALAVVDPQAGPIGQDGQSSTERRGAGCRGGQERPRAGKPEAAQQPEVVDHL